MKRVKAQRDWLQAMAEAGTDGLLVTPAGNGRILSANPGMARLVGLPLDRLLESRWGDLLEGPGDPETGGTDPETGGTDPEAGGMDPETGGTDPEVPMGRSEARLRTTGSGPLEAEVNAGGFSHGGQAYTLAVIRDQSWRRQLERETLRVGERERLLLGKELHDGLGQHLTGVAFMAKTLARKLAARGDREAEDAEEMGRLIKDAVGQIRILSKGLELSEYQSHELPQALEEMSAVVSRLMGVSMEVDLDPERPVEEWRLSQMEATQIYRICHDVVSDAVRNRMAQKVRVQLRKPGGEALLSVMHDGVAEEGKKGGSGSILTYRLRYRARLLDASLEMRENPEGVTTVFCSFKVSGDQT